MPSKSELTEIFNSVLWAEKGMQDSYAVYSVLADGSMRETLKAIEKDELRHIGIVEQILSILRK